MEGKRKAAGETILCHPRLVDGTFCYVISSFVSTSSPKKAQYDLGRHETHERQVDTHESERRDSHTNPFLLFYAGILVLL